MGRTYFGKSMNHLEGRRFHHNEEVEMSMCECLRRHDSGCYCHKTLGVHPVGKTVSVL
jgi:hypothetical protein